MCTQVTKWGNSLAVRLPKALAAELDLKEDSEIEITVVDGKLIITPQRSSYKLDDLLAGITPDNVHGESSLGQAVGAEIV